MTKQIDLSFDLHKDSVFWKKKDQNVDFSFIVCLKCDDNHFVICCVQSELSICV